MTFSRVLSGDPYNTFFHGLCTTSLDFAVGSPLMFLFWCFFMVPGILFQEELWTLFSSCLQYLLEWCGVILLASLCLREAKMWMVTPVGAFLESFQLKIRMKVFRRWWRITEKSGGFFPGCKRWLRIYWPSLLQAFIIFSTLYLSTIATYLPTFLTLSSFNIHPRFVSDDLVFYYLLFTYS